MRVPKILFATVVLAVLGVGMTALADPPGFCPQPPGPPGLECRGCPTYEDPVVCTVRCAGGTQQKTFTNACFASCSGYRIVGECVRTGG